MELRHQHLLLYLCTFYTRDQADCEGLWVSPHELPSPLFEVALLGSSIPFSVTLGHFPHPEDHWIWDHLTSTLPPKSADVLTASADGTVLLRHWARRGEEGGREKAACFQASSPQISAGRLRRVTQLKRRGKQRRGTGKPWTRQAQGVQPHRWLLFGHHLVPHAFERCKTRIAAGD